MNSKTSTAIFLVGLGMTLFCSYADALNADQDSAIRQLLAELDDAKFDVRQNASRALAGLEMKAVPQLVQLVLEGSPEQAWRASKILTEIGTHGDEASMVKIGRILFLLGNRHPELIARAHLLRAKWQLRQLDRVAEKISQLGGQVTRISTNRFNNPALLFREAAPPSVRDSPELDVDSTDSSAADTDQANDSATEDRQTDPFSHRRIADRTSEILGAASDDDIRALRIASGQRQDLIPLEEIAALSNTSFQISINEKWQGTDEDFQLLLDLSSIDYLQLTSLKLSRKIFQTLHRCQLRALSIEQCEVGSAELTEYADRHPETYLNVRGKALLGVRGLVQVRTEANGLVGGCALSDVVADGPAHRAGILVTDVILKVDDSKVTNFQDLLFIIASKKPGQRIEITVDRDGQEKVLQITLGDSGDFEIR